MGKSVIAFKVMVTPRFHFECIFYWCAKQSRQTNNIAIVARMADVTMHPGVLNGIAIVNDENYRAPQQYDPL